MQINVKKLDSTANLPIYATEGASCFDIYSNEDTSFKPIKDEGDYIGWESIIKTGLAFEVPEGYVLKIYSRSGHGFKHNIHLANGTGIIDSDYRGELMVKLVTYDVDQDLPNIGKGERICQGAIEKMPIVTFKEVNKLDETKRGTKGFGSTN